MVGLFQVKEITDVLSIENVTIFGVLICVIILLIYERQKIEKKNDLKYDKLLDIIKEAQNRIDAVDKDNMSDLKEIIKNYHVFTVQVFEKLKSILNNYK